MTSSTPRRALRRDIQGLRAFAVVVVVLEHLFGWPHGGFAGVDVFFVISGFLITGILVREYEQTGHISFRRFYTARAKRILPAATLTLVATVVVGWLIAGRVRAESITWDAFWAFIFGANWNFAAQGTDYFQQDAAVSPLQHFWSLSVEEQFYFVWPWVLLGLLALWARRGPLTTQRVRTIAGIAIGVVIVVSLGIALVQSAAAPTSAYFSTVTRAWELGLGALLAVIAPAVARLPQSVRGTISGIGFVVMVASVFLVSSASVWPAPGALLPVLATVMVIAGGIGGEVWNPILTNRVAVYVGDISFSWYLWHFPVIVFAHIIDPNLGWKGQVAVFALGLLLAIAAYYAVERPLHRSPLWTPRSTRDGWRQWRHDSRRPVLLGTAGAAALVLVAVGAVAVMPRPAATDQIAVPAQGDRSDAQYALTTDIVAGLNATTWPDDIDQQLATSAQWDKTVRDCADPATFASDGCSFGSGERVAYVVGDSLATAYVPVLREVLPDWTIVQFTLNGCEFNTLILASERSQPHCADRIDDAIAAVNEHRPDVVFVTSQWATHRVAGAEKAVPFDEWSAGAEAALDRLAAPTVYVAPPPFEVNIGECYSGLASSQSCISDVNTAWRQSVDVMTARAERVDDFTFVTSRDWFCHYGQCPAVVRGELTRSDLVHPGQRYLAAISDVIGEDVRAALPAE